jgi:hypothetical protein
MPALQTAAFSPMAAMTIHFDIIWPRFIAACTVFALIIATGVYVEIRGSGSKKKKKDQA